MGSRKSRRDFLKQRGLCVECAGACDRPNKTLCSICAPKFAKAVGAYHRRLKEAAFDAYGGAICACCNLNIFEFLTIDHIGGGGAAHRRELRKGDGQSGGGGTRLYLWLKRNGYPPGFRVLCMNCNFGIGLYGTCPHKMEFKRAEISRQISLIN